jgi:hypothetical protein
LEKTNTNSPRTCRVHFGTETKYGKQDTQSLPCTTRSKIFIDRKGILHFRMRRPKYNTAGCYYGDGGQIATSNFYYII